MSKIDLTAFEKFPEPRMEEVGRATGGAGDKTGEVGGAMRWAALEKVYQTGCEVGRD